MRVLLLATLLISSIAPVRSESLPQWTLRKLIDPLTDRAKSVELVLARTLPYAQKRWYSSIIGHETDREEHFSLYCGWDLPGFITLMAQQTYCPLHEDVPDDVLLYVRADSTRRTMLKAWLTTDEKRIDNKCQLMALFPLPDAYFKRLKDGIAEGAKLNGYEFQRFWWQLKHARERLVIRGVAPGDKFMTIEMPIAPTPQIPELFDQFAALCQFSQPTSEPPQQ